MWPLPFNITSSNVTSKLPISRSETGFCPFVCLMYKGNPEFQNWFKETTFHARLAYSILLNATGSAKKPNRTRERFDYSAKFTVEDCVINEWSKGRNVMENFNFVFIWYVMNSAINLRVNFCLYKLTPQKGQLSLKFADTSIMVQWQRMCRCFLYYVSSSWMAWSALKAHFLCENLCRLPSALCWIVNLFFCRK